MRNERDSLWVAKQGRQFDDSDFHPGIVEGALKAALVEMMAPALSSEEAPTGFPRDVSWQPYRDLRRLRGSVPRARHLFLHLSLG